MLDDLACGEFVEGVVGEGAAAGAEVGQDGGDDAAGEPAQRCGGTLGAGQGVMEGLQLRGMEPEASARRSRSRWLRVQRGHGPEDRSRSACPQVGQGRQSSVSGLVHGPQTGASAVPEWIPRRRAADGAVSFASVAATAAGQSGQAGEGAGCGATADRADQDGQGAAVGAERAVGGAVLDRRRLPQPMQTSRFAGSVIRQFGHSGRPWSSRVAGSRRAPQRTHSSMRDLAMQLRQTRCPSSGLSMRTTRWQRGQAGRTIPATPASCSRSMNRRMARCGAR